MQKLRNMIRNADWKKISIYAALYSFFFIIFLYLTFPFDTVRDAIISKIESSGDISVEMESLRPFRLTGFAIKGLRVASASDPSKVWINLDEIRLRVRPTQLLLKRLWLDFDAYAYGGGVAGSFCKRSGTTELAMNFVGLKLSQYSARDIVRTFGSLDLDGMLNGSAELHFNKGNRRNNSGALSMNIDQLRILNINLLSNKLPDLVFEPGRIAMSLKTQTFQIDEFNLKSPHVELTMDGRINLNDAIKRSRLFLNLRFKPSEDFEDALGVLAMGLKEPDAEGYYKLTLNGTPGDIKTRM